MKFRCQAVVPHPTELMHVSAVQLPRRHINECECLGCFGKYRGPEGVNSRPRCASGPLEASRPQRFRIKADLFAGHHVGSIPPTTAIPTATEHDQDHNDENKKRGCIHLGLLLGVSASPRAKPRRLGRPGLLASTFMDRRRGRKPIQLLYKRAMTPIVPGVTNGTREAL